MDVPAHPSDRARAAMKASAILTSALVLTVVGMAAMYAVIRIFES